MRENTLKCYWSGWGPFFSLARMRLEIIKNNKKVASGLTVLRCLSHCKVCKSSTGFSLETKKDTFWKKIAFGSTHENISVQLITLLVHLHFIIRGPLIRRSPRYQKFCVMQELQRPSWESRLLITAFPTQTSFYTPLLIAEIPDKISAASPLHKSGGIAI